MMGELVTAVDHLGNALAAMAQIVEANGLVSEQDAVRFNSHFAAFEESMGGIEGSMRHAAKEECDG